MGSKIRQIKKAQTGLNQVVKVQVAKETEKAKGGK